MKDAKNVFDHVPEIYTRLANIYYKEGKKEEAIALLLYAKDFLAQRMMYSDFFGNQTIMKLLVKDLYSWTEFDLDFMDLFDLYYILDYPSKLLITYFGKDYILDATDIHDIQFNEKHYQDVDDFFERATIKEERITSLYRKIDDIEVLEWK